MFAANTTSMLSFIQTAILTDIRVHNYFLLEIESQHLNRIYYNRTFPSLGRWRNHDAVGLSTNSSLLKLVKLDMNTSKL
jgi:hypothetical protein